MQHVIFFRLCEHMRLILNWSQSTSGDQYSLRQPGGEYNFREAKQNPVLASRDERAFDGRGQASTQPSLTPSSPGADRLQQEAEPGAGQLVKDQTAMVAACSGSNGESAIIVQRSIHQDATFPQNYN